MKISRIACSLAVTTLALGLAACGDDITEQINVNVGAVETSDDLPECTKDIAGQTAFVSETHEFLGCDGKEWQTLSANTVSVGDNVCTSTSLSDDSGFEIFCNGESIGKVKNGQKGDKGDAGTGCKIQESTELTATIACGSETFTMDFTGYVDVPAECDSTDADCAVPLDNVDLSGVSQKGPFVSGTDVTAYELENGRSLKQTGKTFGGKIENQDGSFNIRTVKLKSSYAYLVADGFYRNEVTGENSAATIKLRALTNLDGRSTANINLVTHLEYDRVQRLVTKDNKSVIEAKLAAEKSLFAAFGIDNTGFKGFAEDLNILKEGDGNAALLAVSAMLQGDRTEAQLTALLASLSVDLGDNGQWNNDRQRKQIADWAMKADVEGRLATIRANVKGWKLSDSEPPAFEKHVTNFWTKELDVPACTKENSGRLFAVKNKNSAFYATKDSVFTEGDSSLTRLICDATGSTPAWRLAADIEKDTAAFVKNLPTNTVATGKINTSLVYVKEGKWRHGTELDLAFKKACVADSVGVTDTMTVKHVLAWYICDKNDDETDSKTIPTAWREATTAEADTAGFGIPQTKKDSVKIGNINKSHYYVFDNGKWRFGTELDKALGVCDTTKLNTLANLQGRENDPNAWYTCVDNEYVVVEGYSLPATWRKATNYEMDTYGWPPAEEGKVDSGKVNKNLTYVYEDGAWRLGTKLDRMLLTGCVWDHKDTLVSLSEFAWYTCVSDTADDLSWSMVWRKVADTELDLTYWNYFKDTIGTILTAPSGKKRVWDADTLREPSAKEISLKRACVTEMYDREYPLNDTYMYSCDNAGWHKTDKFMDFRDSKVYRYVEILGRSWMAENVNYEIEGSYCYNDDPAKCAKYGRLYTRAAADYACPPNWYLPDSSKMDDYLRYEGKSRAGKYLKSTSGWANRSDGSSGNGEDSYGFSALPAGMRYGSNYMSEGTETCFWSASFSRSSAYAGDPLVLWLVNEDNTALVDPRSYDDAYSIRCFH